MAPKPISIYGLLTFVLDPSFNVHPQIGPSSAKFYKDQGYQNECYGESFSSFQFRSGTSIASLQQQATFLCFGFDCFVLEFGQFFFFQFSNSLVILSLVVSLICLEMDNQFAFTEYSCCGLLQNMIQQPSFYLHTVHLLKLSSLSSSANHNVALVIAFCIFLIHNTLADTIDHVLFFKIMYMVECMVCTYT